MIRPINECLHPPFFSLIEITYQIKSVNSIFDELSWTLDGDFLYLLFPSSSSEPPFYLFFPFFYERGELFVFFFLSRDYFVSHHYLASVVASACHLSRCHIPKTSHPASDIELIDNDTMES